MKQPSAGGLVATEISRGLGTGVFGRKVVVVEETVSTQELARREASKSARSGTVIFAESQTKGRGRFHRRWHSSPGEDLTFSVVLRAPHETFRPSLITVTASVAVCETVVEKLNLPARIKWPNDVMLADAKLAGILVEAFAPRSQPPAFILGIGLNVNSKPPMKGSTSLKEVSGREFDRTALAREILRSLDGWFEEAQRAHAALVANHWRRFSSTLGTRVTVLLGRQRFTGRAVDLSDDFGLTLQFERGTTMTFRGEQVTLE